MALVVADRVKETTTTTGTGTYTLAGAVTGFEAFSVIGNANTTYYCCTDGTDFEVGIGTYTASGTTLARTTILQSSNSDAAVNWTSGTRDIFVTQPAEKAVFLDANGDATIGGGLTVTGGSSGDTLLKFAMDRSWQFQQSGDDASTRLQLKANVASKSFDIVNSDGDSNFQFNTSATSPTLTLAEDASIIFEGATDDDNETVLVAADPTADRTITLPDATGTVLLTDGDGSSLTALNATQLTSGTVPNARLDAQLQDVAGLAVTNGNFIVGDGSNFVAESGATARASLGLGTAATSATGDFATAAQGSTADSAMQDLSDDTSPTLGGNLSTGGNQIQLSQTSGNAIVTTGSLGSADLGILRASAGTGGSDTHGFTIKYMGTRSGNNNSFSLFMDNQTGTDVEAITVLQDGKVGINNTAPTAPLDVTGNIVVSGTVDGRDLATDGTKLDGIEASADVTDTANVTAAGALMDSEVTNLAQVKAFDSSDYATAAQGSTADAAMPKAGGTFTGDVTFTGDNYNIVFDKSDDALEFADNAKAVFGAGGDLQIYHSGSGSFISDAGTGNLRIGGSAVTIENSSFNETMMLATQNGAVELYHDNVKKLETTADGVTLTSTDAGDADAPILKLYRDSASPADGDDMGRIQFTGKNDAGQDVDYAVIFAEIGDATDGTEDSRLKFLTVENGSGHTTMEVKFGTVSVNGQLNITTGGDIRFEGATADDFETVLSPGDPTADRTITLPDATGTVLTTGNSDTPTTTTSSSDADFVLVDDGGTMKKITPANLGITAGAASTDDATALAIALG